MDNSVTSQVTGVGFTRAGHSSVVVNTQASLDEVTSTTDIVTDADAPEHPVDHRFTVRPGEKVVVYVLPRPPVFPSEDYGIACWARPRLSSLPLLRE